MSAFPVTDNEDDYVGNSLTVGSRDERENRARSPSQERSWKKDKYGLQDYNFIKVLGKGSFGKVSGDKHPIPELQMIISCISDKVFHDFNCCWKIFSYL